MSISFASIFRSGEKALSVVRAGIATRRPVSRGACVLWVANILRTGLFVCAAIFPFQGTLFSQTRLPADHSPFKSPHPRTKATVTGVRSQRVRQAGPQVVDTWDCGGGDGNWSNGANWDAGVPPTPTSDVVITNACPSTVDKSFPIHNLTINAGGVATIPDGQTLTINGDTMVIDGQLSLNSTGAGGDATLTIGGASVLLSGTGLVNMSDHSTNFIGGSGTLINQLTSSQGIQGSGRIQCNLQNNNNAIIDATGQKNPLILRTVVTNAGILEGTTGHLYVAAIVTNSSSGSLQGNVFLGDGTSVAGGTLGSPGGMVVAGLDLGISHHVKLANLIILGQLSTQDGVNLDLQGTITDNGNITTSSNINASALTLTGTGAVVFDGTASLLGDSVTNQVTIFLNRAASINVNSFTNQTAVYVDVSNTPSSILVGSGGFLNQGTIGGGSGGMNGGLLNIGGTGGVVINNGSVLGQVQLTDGVTIQGGLLNGTMELKQGALDGTVSVTNQQLINISNNDTGMFKGTFINNGRVNCSGVAEIKGIVTMNGVGMVISSNGCVIEGAIGGDSLILNSILEGAGRLGNKSMNLTIGKTGILNANSAVPIQIQISPGLKFSNGGEVEIDPISMIIVTGNCANYNISKHTFSGGKWIVGGVFQADNVDIHTNVSTIVDAGLVKDQNGNNALANFSSNRGSFTLASPGTFDNNFRVEVPFTNNGKFTVQKGRNLIVEGSGMSYSQSGSAAATTNDGTISVPPGGQINFAGGIGQGAGTYSGNLTVGNAAGGAVATFIIGDSTKKSAPVSVSNDYTQLPTGVMDVQIGGTNPGSQYSQVSVTGPVSLTGTLNIKLINKFKPQIGQTFTIVTSPSGVNGTFSTVNGTSISPNSHFSISYNSNSVVLTVVSGP